MHRHINNNSDKNSKNLMTSCHKGGIKIKEGNNSYSADPFAGVNPFSNPNEEKNKQIN